MSGLALFLFIGVAALALTRVVLLAIGVLIVIVNFWGIARSTQSDNRSSLAASVGGRIVGL